MADDPFFVSLFVAGGFVAIRKLHADRSLLNKRLNLVLYECPRHRAWRRAVQTAARQPPQIPHRLGRQARVDLLRLLLFGRFCHRVSILKYRGIYN